MEELVSRKEEQGIITMDEGTDDEDSDDELRSSVDAFAQSTTDMLGTTASKSPGECIYFTRPAIALKFFQCAQKAAEGRGGLRVTLALPITT